MLGSRRCVASVLTGVGDIRRCCLGLDLLFDVNDRCGFARDDSRGCAAPKVTQFVSSFDYQHILGLLGSVGGEQFRIEQLGVERQRDGDDGGGGRGAASEALRPRKKSQYTTITDLDVTVNDRWIIRVQRHEPSTHLSENRQHFLLVRPTVESLLHVVDEVAICPSKDSARCCRRHGLARRAMQADAWCSPSKENVYWCLNVRIRPRWNWERRWRAAVVQPQTTTERGRGSHLGTAPSTRGIP